MLFLPFLVTAVGLMTAVWLASLRLRDASIVDRVWGLGFLLLVLQSVLQTESVTTRGWLVAAFVALWGLRLSLYIHLRNRGKAEDPRYQDMRRRHGQAFWWKSFFIVFLLQGVLMWLISAPLVAVQRFSQSEFPTWLDGLGISVWLVGFVFESVGDYQLSRFKENPANRGKVCRVGLWDYTRHPNYFGEILVWWGFWILCLNVSYGWCTVFSPALVTWLLLKVSGVTLLEGHLKSTKPGYQAYLDEVPALIPRLKKGRR